jgi:hypothetical protein
MTDSLAIKNSFLHQYIILGRQLLWCWYEICTNLLQAKMEGALPAAGQAAIE